MRAGLFVLSNDPGADPPAAVDAAAADDPAGPEVFWSLLAFND